MLAQPMILLGADRDKRTEEGRSYCDLGKLANPAKWTMPPGTAELIRKLGNEGSRAVDLSVAAMAQEWTLSIMAGFFPIEDYREQIFMSPKSLFRDIPVAVRPIAARAAIKLWEVVGKWGDAMVNYVVPPGQVDCDRMKLRVWMLLHAFPFLCLQRWEGMRRKTKETARILTNRILRYVAGDFEALYEEAMTQSRVNMEAAEKRRQERADAALGPDGVAEQGRTRAFDQHLRDGENSKAMKEAMRNGGGYQNTLKPEMEELFREKLKKGVLPNAARVEACMTDIRLKGTYFKCDARQLRKVLNKMGRAKGPGLSGWRYAHLKNMRSGAGKWLRAFEDAMVLPVNLYLKGGLVKTLSPFLIGGVGGVQDTRRVFSAADTFIRMADSWAQGRAVEMYTRHALFPYNLGVGKRAARESLMVWVQSCIRKYKGVSDLVILEVDAWNMFFEICREVILEEVWKRAPMLYPLVAHLAAPQFIVFFQGKSKEEISAGIPIGSGIASFVACLVEECVINELRAQMGGRLLDIRAYIDNVFLVLRAQDVERVLSAMEHIGKPYGLLYGKRESHRHKMLFVNPENISRPLEQWMAEFSPREFEVAVNGGKKDGQGRPLGGRAQGIVIVGIPVGTEAFTREFLDAKVEKTKKKLRVLVNTAIEGPRRIPLPAALVLGRSSVVAMLDSHRRVMDPAITADILEEFDCYFVSEFQNRCRGAEWCAQDGLRFVQIHLPASKGGWSIRQLGGGQQYAAALAAAVDGARSGVPDGFDWDKFTQHADKFNQLVNVKDQLKGTAMERFEKMKNLAGGKRSESLQKILSNRIRDTVFEIWWARLDDTDRKIVLAQSMPEAGLWLTQLDFGATLDGEGEKLSFSDEEFGYLMRRSLVGADPHNLGGVRGLCGRRTAAGNLCTQQMDGKLVHAESLCQSSLGGKHTALQSALCKVARECGTMAIESYIVRDAPLGAQNGGGALRVDALIRGVYSNGQTDIGVDVANIDVLSVGRITQAIGVDFVSELKNGLPERGLAAKDARKTNLYDDHCSKLGIKFIPATTDTRGGFGENAGRLVRMMGSILATADQLKTSEARMRVKRRLQAAFLKPIARNGLIYYEKVRQEQVLADMNAHLAGLDGN